MHASTFIYHQQRQHRRKFPSSEARGESRFFTTLQRSRPCINASYCFSPLIKKKKIIGKPRNGRTGSSTNSTDENFPIGMIVGQKRALADATRDLFSCASDNALQETTAVSDNVNPPVHCPLPRRSLGLQSPFSPFSLDFLLFTSPSIWTDLLTTSCLARNIHYEYFRMVKARERV